VSGSIALYGTYKISDKDKSMSWHIEASTYPNWVGQDQKRPVNSITADELKYTNPAASTAAATTLLTWKRVK
jgi:hypothetical protein